MLEKNKFLFILVILLLPLCYIFLEFQIAEKPEIPNRYIVDDSKKTCEIEDWNQETTSTIPNYENLQNLAAKKQGVTEGLEDGELRLLSAYLYPDQIVVTTTRQRGSETGKTIHCRYYDCNRDEIPNSNFTSFIFPMTAVHCTKRRGAHFISLSFELTDTPPKPIPFVRRLEKKPPHDVGLCVGQIYGPDKKWTEIVEFVEHHKMIGVTMFYFTVFQMDAYSRALLEEYVRTGYAEVTYVNTEYTDGLAYLHIIQINDCFFRSRHHSKWMLNIDFDEFLVSNRKNFFKYIDSLSSKFAEVIFSIRLVQKTARGLETYNSTEEVINNLLMTKYHESIRTVFQNTKVMVQPTKLEIILLHYAQAILPDYKSYTISKSIATVVHYRNRFGLLQNRDYENYTIETIDKKHTDILSLRVAETVENVFKKHQLSCDAIPKDWQRLTGPVLRRMKIC